MCMHHHVQLLIIITLRAYQKNIFESQLNEMLSIFEEIDNKYIFKILKI